MELKIIVGVVTLAVLPVTSHAGIVDSEKISVDFSKPLDASSKTTWVHRDELVISKDGLGWKGPDSAEFDGWIQTKPIPIGLTWRTPSGFSVQAAIRPRPAERKLGNGQSFTPDIGNLFVRYSPDLRHWSSWQIIGRAEARTGEEKSLSGRFYSGRVEVPMIDREEYLGLLGEYSKRDVPWGSDEEAAVQWVVSRDPEYFSRKIPFIGYVQFLFESQMYGGDFIRNMDIDVIYAVSGMSTIPKPPYDEKKHVGHWRFVDPSVKKLDDR